MTLGTGPSPVFCGVMLLHFNNVLEMGVIILPCHVTTTGMFGQDTPIFTSTDSQSCVYVAMRLLSQ
jgi:hypothetical protein